MSNFAAIIPEAKAPLIVQDVGLYTPGPRELVIKNEVIAFNPVEYKMAKLALFPMKYPAIIGSSFGGTVHSVGSEVTTFRVGDKVAAAKSSKTVGNQYGAFQQYVVADEKFTTKVPSNVNVEISASLTGNLPTIVGLFTGRAGLEKPNLDGRAVVRNKKILIYGGSSSVGSLSVQYVSQAGYTVVTTSSPSNHEVVSKLGAAKIIDHTQAKEILIKALIDEGPFDLVVDTIATAPSTAISGAVVAAQGGGKLYATLPPFGPETLPANVTRVYQPWSTPLFEPGNEALPGWAFHEYLTSGLARGKIVPLSIQKVDGGLKNVNVALDLLEKGVSGVKLVLDPWA